MAPADTRGRHARGTTEGSGTTRGSGRGLAGTARSMVGMGSRALAAGTHAVTRPLDWAAHVASLLWRSMFGTAAALCLLAGLLHAIGRPSDAYSSMIVAGALGAAGTFLGILAMRVETDPDLDSETTS